MKKHELEGLDALAALSTPQLASWLRRGALNWSRERDQRARLLAFSPATLLADVADEGAGGFLTDELMMAFGGIPMVPAEAVVLALEGWWLPHDGALGASLLVQLAAELAAPRLLDGLDALINKPGLTFVEPRARLGSVISTAACERLSRKGAEGIGADARRVGILAEEDAARILVYICSGRLDRIVELAAEFRIFEGGVATRSVLMSLLRQHDPDEVGQILARNPKTAAQAIVRDLVAEVASALAPRTLNSRKWRVRTPKGPANVQKTWRTIEDRYTTKYPDKTWAIIGDIETISIFNSKEGIDPNVDSTVPSNIYNIEAANVRRR